MEETTGKSRQRKMIGLTRGAKNVLEHAQRLYGKTRLTDTLVDALALYVQIGEEWEKGAEIIVRFPEKNTEFRILKPQGITTKQSAKKSISFTVSD